MAPRVRERLLARDRPRRDPRLVPEARPAEPVPQPGHVHRRARQRDHDGDLRPRRSSAATRASLWFSGTIAVWLWLTVLFANFAEAIAEGRGKAQANALRATRTTTIAHRQLPRRRARGRARARAPARRHRRRRGRRGHPGRRRGRSRASARSTSRRSPASPRRSSARPAATARPSPAARGCSPTGSSIEVTQEPGESFLDRMIALVEGAERRKTPNEIALNILLAGLTITFLVAVVTLKPFAVYAGTPHLADGADRAARRADPDDDRRPALGDRHRRHGPARPAQRARHVRPCGRGRRATSTCSCSTRPARSRSATGRPPSSSRSTASSEQELAEVAQLASLADETPEGRSIVVLAKEQYGLRGARARTSEATFIPFTADDADERRRPERQQDPQGRRRRRQGASSRRTAARSRASSTRGRTAHRRARRHAARRRPGQLGARRRST